MRILVSVAVLSIALAGCASSSDQDQPPATPTPEDSGGSAEPEAPPAAFEPLPWGLIECRYLIAEIPVEEARLRPHLPDGFEAIPYVSLTEAASVKAVLSLEAFLCSTAVGLDGEASDVSYASIFILTDPADEYKRPGTSGYAVKWNTLVADESSRSVLLEHGVLAYAGQVDMTFVGAANSPTTGSASIEMGTWATFTIEAAFPAGPGGFGAFAFVEFTPTDRGLVTWEGEAAFSEEVRGLGRVEAPTGTWVADVVGGTTAEASVLTGVFSITEGRVTLPDPAQDDTP